MHPWLDPKSRTPRWKRAPSSQAPGASLEPGEGHWDGGLGGARKFKGGFRCSGGLHGAILTPPRRAEAAPQDPKAARSAGADAGECGHFVQSWGGGTGLGQGAEAVPPPYLWVCCDSLLPQHPQIHKVTGVARGGGHSLLPNFGLCQARAPEPPSLETPTPLSSRSVPRTRRGTTGSIAWPLPS